MMLGQGAWMKRLVPLAIATIMYCVSMAPVVARAQTTAEAQSALDARHYADAARIAQALIEQGSRTGPELAPLYRVLGLAAAYQNDEETARVAFTRWLALEPEGRLERTLPDEVRSPFMEARGFWSSTTGRFGATADLAEGQEGLTVRVTDPSSMAARVRARVRLQGGVWTDTVRAPSEVFAVATPGLAAARALDYSITFIDEHGNRIWQDGTDAAPRHLALPTSGVTVASSTDAHPASHADATGFHAGAVVAAVLAVGATVGAAIAHGERERLASIYNGDGASCTGSGATRGEICAPQRVAIAGDETTAIILYSVGGAAAIAAVVLLAVAPTAPTTEHASLACGAGPGIVGFSCGGTF